MPGAGAPPRRGKRLEDLARANVTLLIDDPGKPFPKGVMVYGMASLDSDNVLAERVEILEGVMPHEAAEGLVGALAATHEQAVIRVRPTKLVSWDYSKPGFMG